MEFFLNGSTRVFNDDPKTTLLEYLRKIEGIKSPKDGCSSQGVCGACTVQLDDRAVLSCKTPMSKVKGRKVVTIEGFERVVQEAFAKAFVEKGGIQCGFCIPGIVASARVLLLKNLNPSVVDIKKAIQKNLCRCTGYKKIIDSILYAAEILRENRSTDVEYGSGKVGERLPKFDSYDTVLGKRPFVDDMEKVGMYYGALKFSDYPRAHIVSINIEAASRVEGVLKIVTAKDIPGERIGGLIVKDWPMMVDIGEETRYIGDVLAGVVAKTEKIAKKAISKIIINYEILKPSTTVDQSLKKETHKIHEKGNILSETNLLIGDAKAAIENSAYVSKGTYYTQRIEHAFLETESCLVVPTEIDGVKGLKIYSQGQGAYEDRKGIARILGIDESQVVVVQIQNGGGFGGKEDLSVQGHAALFSFLTGKAVKITLTRPESMQLHPKRHPMRMKYLVGCDKSGKFTGLIAEIDGDTGAYASVGMKVLERAAGHSAGAYVMPEVDVVARAIYTNNIPCGAMRGFGVNQTAFAIESCIDDLCEQGGFDRWQFRYDNAIRAGERLVTGQLMTDKDGVGLRDTLLAVKEDFYKADYAGIACGIKNTGIGNGMADTTKAKIVIESLSKFVIHHGWSEMGQGVHTMAIHTLCEELDISPEKVNVVVNTSFDTVCGMTTSSRGTSLVGNAVIDACKKIKKDLENHSMAKLVGNEYLGEWICDWTSEIGFEKEGMGHVTHYSYGYATQVVMINKRGKIEKIVAAHDAGRIMNPTLFEGQIEGAVHMGLGYALTENFPMKDGYPISTNLAKCKIIRVKDMPEVKVIGVEKKDQHGPYGAKGVGEIGLVPTAAAVANAIYQYDKVRRFSLPIGVKK